MTTIGHNSGESLSSQRLQQFITRIEKLLEEKAALAADIKEVFSEAKSAGFEPKVMRGAIKKRAADKAELEEYEALLQVYLAALGG